MSTIKRFTSFSPLITLAGRGARVFIVHKVQIKKYGLRLGRGRYLGLSFFFAWGQQGLFLFFFYFI